MYVCVCVGGGEFGSTIKYIKIYKVLRVQAGSNL